MSKFGLLLAIFFSMMFLTSRCQLSVSTDFRTRAEYRHGYMQPAVDTAVAATFVSQRTRINFDFTKDKFLLRFGVQDVRVWGQDDKYNVSGNFGDTRSLALSEAYAKYLFASNFSLTLGRQAWSYDQQRLLSARDWNQAGVFYDAALLSYINSKLQVDLGLSFNSKAESNYDVDYYTDMARIKTLDFLYLKYNYNDNISASIIGVGAGYNDANKRNRINMMYTYGATLGLKYERLFANLEGYYQCGDNAKNNEVDAYMFSANLEYNLVPNVFKIGSGVDYFSGHDASNTNSDYAGKDHTFDILYGARYKHYGFMNQYSFTGKSYENGGLQKLLVYLNYTPNKTNTLKLAAYFFSMTNNYADKESTQDNFESMDKNLGAELNLSYGINFAPKSKFDIGVAYYFENEQFYAIKNVDYNIKSPSYYMYAIVRFTPELFNSSSEKK